VVDLAVQTATEVWFDPRLKTLSVIIDGVVASIDFAWIPKADFESMTPVTDFSLGSQGAVIVCRHDDGAETWLPVDMWLPGGFTPAVN
jgi:hypothetical protein